MKKKNVIGHMTVPKTPSNRWYRRFGLIPRLVCLLLAALIWLFIVNANEFVNENTPPVVPGASAVETVVQ